MTLLIEIYKSSSENKKEFIELIMEYYILNPKLDNLFD